MRYKYGLFILVFFLLYFNEVKGQILSPVLKKGEFEAGCTIKWFRRESTPEIIMQFGWWYGTIFARYGITHWFTISAEGLMLSFEDERFPERDYRDYIIGAGSSFRILQIKRHQINIQLHYVERFSFDRSETRYHKNNRSLIGVIQFCQQFSFNKQEVMLWIAPAYVYDECIQYPDGQYLGIKNKSINNYGVAFGSNILLFRHITSFIHLVYADFFQPRIGISYKF